MLIKRIIAVFLVSALLLGLSGCSANNKEQSDSKTAISGFKMIFFETDEDADAILILAPKACVMIDTGLLKDSAALVDRMVELGVEKLDLLILTHPDKDHIGGAASILNTFDTEKVFITNGMKNSEEMILLKNALDKCKDKAVQLSDNTSLEYGDLKLIVYPPKREEYKDANDYSIAVMADYAGHKFFLPGDAEKERIGELLDEKLDTVDVYKLPHHGRESKKADKLLSTLNPKYCVVTAKEPDSNVSRMISRINAVLYSTYKGEIVFSIDEKDKELVVTQTDLTAQ